MKEKIKTCLAVCILVITVPYVVTLVFQGGETSTGTGTIQEALKEPAKENSGPQKTSGDGPHGSACATAAGKLWSRLTTSAAANAAAAAVKIPGSPH